jgi:hypothetical protein
MADRQQLAAEQADGRVNGRPSDTGHGGAEQPAVPADEREAGFAPVGCERCGAVALVAKFSPQHTSVQWSGEAVRTCAEFSARVAAGEQTALIDTCASLRDCIDRAVLEGRLPITPP